MRVNIFIILIALIPMMGYTQEAQMSEQQMQQMMESFQQIQACISKIDQAVIQDLANRGKSMQSEIKSMCSSGQRDQAQQLAVAFAEDYLANEQIKILRKCGENVAGIMPNMPSIIEEINKTKTHVCDAY